MELNDIKKKQDELLTAFEAFKSANDREIAELKQKGSVDPTIRDGVKRANDEITRLSEEIKSMQTAMARSGQNGGGNDQEKEAKAARAAALRKFLVKGERFMSEAEIKAMSVGTAADGGHVVHSEFQDLVDASLLEISPMRQLATVQKMNAMNLDISVDTNEMSAGWATETGARAATNTPTLAKVSIAAEEMYANPQITQALLEDASINVEQYVAKKIADKFASLEGTAFVTGDGSGKPKGIMGYAAGTAYNQVEQVNSEDANEITADGLIALIYKLKEGYRKNGKFLMHSDTVAKIRKLKDSNGQYLWQPGLAGGQPPTLLGKELHTDPNVAVEAADALAVAFGDFKTGYLILDRVELSILRDPYSNKPYVGFYARKRVGGGVVVSEAIKILKCAVTA